ncbi:MAG TPA: sialate O-acetylesterase, partial [Pirellulales bacterium]|nr:sialate O-acetylesterase [Pirellulales bacterium]
PKNKQGAGNRLAQWAMVDVYGKAGVGESPLPAKFEFSGNQATITFTNVGTGLKAKDGTATGFAIAGDDKKFVWADARIEGDKVVVSSPQVAKPVAVRYAWADNPVWSVENSADLPATPFRTDDWQ